jgi:hypothetical protein
MGKHHANFGRSNSYLQETAFLILKANSRVRSVENYQLLKAFRRNMLQQLYFNVININ